MVLGEGVRLTRGQLREPNRAASRLPEDCAPLGAVSNSETAHPSSMAMRAASRETFPFLKS
jgi:hypothetical protein